MSGIDTHIFEKFPLQPLALDGVRQLFITKKCNRLYVKELAWNHDSKRQIYLTGDLSAFNIFPNKIQHDPPMPHWIEVTQKPLKKKENQRIFGHLDFDWVTIAGDRDAAGDAKIIYYPQYPEVRLSGLLRGVKCIPSKYLREKAGETYSNRLLFLGVTSAGKTIGFLAVGHEALRDELRQIVGYDILAGINALALFADELSPRRQLLDALENVHRKGWIASQKLTQDGPVPYRARNGVGYTLEAELGILPNGNNLPDFMGWEVKAYSVNKLDRPSRKPVTLFTPEPDMGVYSDSGVHEFLQRWGYADKSGKVDRRNFGGVYRMGEIHSTTGLTLRVSGFDPDQSDCIDPSGHLALVSLENEIAAGWSFKKLIDCWRVKHAAAVYIPAVRHAREDQLGFVYGANVLMCENTDFVRVLRAVCKRRLYLDPALKAEGWSSGNAPVKRRNQFRMRMSDIPCLYKKVGQVCLLRRVQTEG